MNDTDDTERLLASSVADMVRRRIEPRLDGTPPEPVSKDVLVACLRDVAATGYFGVRVPEAWGGSGLTHLLSGTVTEALPAFLGVACIAQEATIFRLVAGAGDAVREEYLPGLLAGDLVAGSAVSEPDVGSASNAVTATVERRGDGYRLRARKLWTTNGTVADLLVVLARDTETGSTARVLVDTRTTPVAAADLPMSGLTRGHLCSVTVDATVPADHVLTSVSTSTKMTDSWTLNRVSMGLIACALARSAVDYAIAYARTREQFGRAIARFQLVQALVADAATSVEAARLLCRRALADLDAGRPAVLSSSMAKLFATETAIQAILKAQQVAGSYGVSRELPFDEWLRDARMLTFPDGTSQIQQLIIGRELLGVSAFT